MNKKTKGLITAALGASLVFGSASTFALWQDTETLTTTANTIYTGDLDLTGDFTGKWRWAKQSYTSSPTKVDTDWTAAARMVPGDAVKYYWTSVPSIVLTGDTLHATLYLNGVLVTPADLKPLVVQINGSTVNSAYSATGIAIAVNPDNKGTVLTQTNANAASNPTLPSIVIGLPALAVANAVAPGTQHANDPTTYYGYGRNRTLTNVINPSDIKIRLTQTTSGFNVFDVAQP
jgi:alternate signal-mediated exported protein